MQLRTTPTTACLCLALALPLALTAQADSAAQQDRHARSARNQISVLGGVSHGARLDVTASPVTFGGFGYDAATEYTHRTVAERVVLVLSLDGGVQRFAPARADAGASERVSNAEVGAALLHRMTKRANGTTLALGVATTANVTLTQHRFDDPTQRLSDFVVAYGTVGPAAMLRAPIASGIAALRLSTPLVGLVDHPYIETRSDYAPVIFRAAGPRELRGVNGAISFEPASAQRIGMMWAYRFSLLHYADTQPLRSGAQSVSVGVVTRFGQTP